MKTFKIFFLIGMGMLLSPLTLHAEWIDGEVKKIDLKAKMITVGEIDPITETEELEEVVIDDQTKFAGIKSFEELRVDDDISVEVKYDEPTDSWKALSVEVPEAGD